LIKARIEGVDLELQGDQYPKGLSEEQVRDIANEEAARVLDTLQDTLSTQPARADGNINQRDFMATLELAREELKRSNDERKQSSGDHPVPERQE
jgi:hypothetical protein